MQNNHFLYKSVFVLKKICCKVW